MELNIKWNEKEYQEFIIYLKSISEVGYKEFHSKLTFTKYEILGIRLPKLRAISKEISKGDYKSFLRVAGSTYYEEVMVSLLVMSLIKDKDEVMNYFWDSVKLIDNWALCDTFCNSLKIVEKNKDYFFKVVNKLLKSKYPFEIRVGLILILCYYIEKENLNFIFNTLESIRSKEYYVNMASSWLLCEVFIKYQKESLEYLEKNTLDKFTINKAISKIRDSYRVSKETKNYILKYRK